MPRLPGSRYYTEPLDPACLDRFVLQLKTDGAVSAGRWDEAQSKAGGDGMRQSKTPQMCVFPFGVPLKQPQKGMIPLLTLGFRYGEAHFQAQ